MSVFLNSTSRRKYEKTKEIPNLMFMWGFQAFVHEIGFLQDFIMPNDENPLRCCGLNGNRKLPSFFRNRQCMPIYVSSDDPVFDNSVNCLEFTRAQRGHDSCHFAKPRFVLKLSNLHTKKMLFAISFCILDKCGAHTN